MLRKFDDLSMFPNIGVLASYDSIKQFIFINSVERSEFEKCSKGRKIEIDKIIRHEMQHYLDNIGTLWGRKHLIDTYEALIAFKTQDEQNFYKIYSLYKSLRNNKFNNYYSTNNKHTKNFNKPWTYVYTSGLRFNYNGYQDFEKPIIMTRFSNSRGELLCRVPVSIESLLEVNAMASEFITDVVYLASLDNDTRLVEEKSLERRCFEWVYNKDLAVYSVILHLTANEFKISDVVESLNISKQISNLVLNLPDSYIQSIKIPEDVEAWGAQNESFIKDKNLGYIYFILVKNYKELFRGTFDIDDLLLASGLPSQKIINEDVIRIMKEQIDLIKRDGLQSILKKKLEYGYEFFLNNTIKSNEWAHSELIHKYKIPIFFGDDEYENDWDNFTDNFVQFMKEFSGVCGI